MESQDGLELTHPSNPQENYHHYGDTILYDVDDMALSSCHITLTSKSTIFYEGVKHTFAHWRVLLAGQILSLSLSASGALSSSLHFECDLSAPAFQSVLLYLLMSFHLLPCYSKCTLQTNLEEEAKETPRRTGEARIPSNDSEEEEEAINHMADYDNQDNTITDQKDDEKKTQHSLCFGYIRIHAPVWVYFIRGLLDVEANYFTFLGYRYTTFSSASLFDSLAIPSAMIASRLILGRKYHMAHLIGAMVCMCGVIWNVLVDYHQDIEDSQNEDQDNKYPDKTLGDFLTILGGILYGLNDVLAEIAVKNYGGTHEFLGMVGFFGTIISVVQAVALETDQIKKYFYKPELAGDENTGSNCSLIESWSFLISYSVVMYISYVGTAFFLKVSEAAILNLSLLTADFWSVIFTIVVQQILPSPMFWVALFLIISGVFIYEIAPSPLVEENDTRPNHIAFFSTEHSKDQHDDQPLVSQSNGHGNNNNCSPYNDDDVWAYDKDDDEIANFTIT